MRIVLLRASWITGIKRLEERLTTTGFHVPLGALPAGRLAIVSTARVLTVELANGHSDLNATGAGA
jgi:hypothetical protein